MAKTSSAAGGGGKKLLAGATVCSILGLVLLVAGAVVYYGNSNDGEQVCACPEGESGDGCCTEVPTLCDACYCTDSLSDHYCADFEDTSSSGGAGLPLAIAGLVVCVISAVMLCTMKACKSWSEKHQQDKKTANPIV